MVTTYSNSNLVYVTNYWYRNIIHQNWKTLRCWKVRQIPWHLSIYFEWLVCRLQFSVFFPIIRNDNYFCYLLSRPNSS